MEAIYTPSPAVEQPVINKQRKRPSRKNSNKPRSSVPSRRMENVGPAIHGRPIGSLLFAPPRIMNPPPSLYFSYPPSLPPQPPLLPLPVPNPNRRFYSLPNYNNNNNTNVPFPPTRSPSSSPPKPAAKITNHPLTPKKPSKQVSKPEPKAAVSPGAVPFGPDPNVLPKDVRMALSPKLVRKEKEVIEGNYQAEWLSSFDDELMTISSPPASSLPLPSLCLRPKKKLSMLSCTAEVAVAAEDGVTDDLRRILRLR